MSEAALEVSTRFDWDRCAATIAGIYRDLARYGSEARPQRSFWTYGLG
jgi:hypothetical protein